MRKNQKMYLINLCKIAKIDAWINFVVENFLYRQYMTVFHGRYLMQNVNRNVMKMQSLVSYLPLWVYIITCGLCYWFV